jgi:superfamily I DNA/RNA helicase
MCLELPPFTKMVEQQRKVYGLKLDGRFLVEGPPGTGKSVVALHRAANYARNNRPPTIIMFSRMLRIWTESAIEIAAKEQQCTKAQTDSINVQTYDAWFPTWFEQTFNRQIPRVQVNNALQTIPTKYAGRCTVCDGITTAFVDFAYKNAKKKWKPVHERCIPLVPVEPEYEGIDVAELDRIKSDLMRSVSPPTNKTLDIVIDEGQDLPNVFYQLIHQFARSITVYADGAQVINDGEKKTLPNDIAASLNVEPNHRQLLTQNHRNAKEVALLAESFRPRDFVPADPPERNCSEPPHIMQFKSLDDVANHVKLIANNFSNKSIGIFSKYTGDRDNFARALSKAGYNNYQVYRSEDWRTPLDPCAKGVFLATNTVAKGLEFDIVIAASLEKWPIAPSEAEDGVFYVLLSRSKDVLKLVYTGEQEPIFFTTDKYRDKLKTVARKTHQ